MSNISADAPTGHTTSSSPPTSLERELEAFAAGLQQHAAAWDRAGRISPHARLEFERLRVHADMLRLCDALGRSQSLGVVLGLLGPVLATELAAACNLASSAALTKLTTGAPWFGPERSALVRHGSEYVLSGRCSAALEIDVEKHAHLLVRTGEDSYALVPLSAAGVQISEARTGGLACAALRCVQLSEVRLGADQVGRLSADAFERLRTRHLAWLARALCSFSAELFEATLQFAGSRPFQGGRLSDSAVVRHRLADLAAHPRLFTAQARAAAQSGEPLRSLLLAETLSEQLPVFVKQCQQLHGGRGFLMVFSVARAYRDVLDLACLLGPRAQLRRSIAQRLPHAPSLHRSTASFASAELQAFRLRARTLIARHIQSAGTRWEENPTAVAELHALFAREGMTTVRLGSELGSAGKDFGYSLILAEELMAGAPAGVAVSLMIAAGAVVPLLAREAAPQLRAELWPLLKQGKAVLSFGVTEPDGGSDLLHSLHTRATDAGDAWVLNGRKMFITNGPIADFVLVLARTSDRPGPFHSSFIVVPTRAPGVTVSQPYVTLGLCASPTGFVEFREVRVPKHHVLGRVGLGMHLLAESISEERTLIAMGVLALACTLVQHALLRTTDSPESEVHVTDRLIAWLARLDALRSLGSETAQSIVRGERDYAAAALVKFVASEAAQEAIECAAEAIAACGDDCDAQRYNRALRDTRVFSVFAGTNETLRELVGASVAGRARFAKQVLHHD